MIRKLPWCLLLVGVFVLSTCSSGTVWKNVTYVAGGTATMEEVDFERVGTLTVEKNYNIIPPYTENIGDCTTGSYLYVSVINDGTSGYVTAEIDVDGVPAQTVTDPYVATVEMTL